MSSMGLITTALLESDMLARGVFWSPFVAYASYGYPCHSVTRGIEAQKGLEVCNSPFYKR